MKLYILYYDEEDNGSRENWSVFYCPCEVFSTEEKRAARRKELEANPDYAEYAYEEQEVELDAVISDDEEEE